MSTAEHASGTGDNSLANNAESRHIQARIESASQRILTGKLPLPIRERWQPLRAGLQNLFLFEDERFPFADGRLLLRGSNGTGKSRVLAMTLPLLMDGSLKPTRVEPDRDASRQVAWNVLMDDQTSGTGYTWLEFGRVANESDDGDGNDGDQYLTIGMGIRAVRNGPPMKSWFFVTERRVDQSLSLKSVDGVPLTQRQLAEALDGNGQVIETAADYRRVVDEKLFRLGDRYEPLIDLLLQLRQPQLAKKLDIEQLEAALRGALPPLKEALLDDAAEAFRDLDQYRSSLAADRKLLADVERFVRPYRDHVRRGVKRSIKQLTSTHSRYESAQKNIRSIGETLEQNRLRLADHEAKRTAARIAIERNRAAISELEQSPEMRDARRLDELRVSASRLESQVDDARQELAESEKQKESASQNLEERRAEESRQTAVLTKESITTQKQAAPEALQNEHGDLLKNIPNSDANKNHPKSIRTAIAQLHDTANRFAKSALHLQKLNAGIAESRRQRDVARADTERLANIAEQRAEILDQQTTSRDELVASTWQAILKWYTETPLQDLLPKLESWADEWHAWTTSPESNAPSTEHLRVAESAVVSLAAKRTTHVQTALAAVQNAIADAEAESDQLNTGHSIEPLPRNGRDPKERAATRQNSVVRRFGNWSTFRLRYLKPNTLVGRRHSKTPAFWMRG